MNARLAPAHRIVVWPKSLIAITSPTVTAHGLSAAAIAALPAEHRQHIEPILVRVTESTRRRRRILTLVQEALAQLRLDMKYLMFDLEATRRERDALKETTDGDE